MSRKLNLSTFNFSEEQIRAINEIIFEDLSNAPELAAIHSFWTGIEYKKEIGFINGHGLVGKKKQGCNPNVHDWNINTRKVTWDPQGWEVYLDECADDLNDTAAVYCREKGVKIDDLTDTDYMEIVIRVLEIAIKETLIRFVWFGDKNAANYHVSNLPKAAATEQTAGSALVGTVYLAVTSSTAGAVKCALANGTVIYLAGTASTGNAESGKTYYSKDTVNTVAVVDGGLITPGLDPTYFDVIDGLFKQLEAAVTGGAKTVTIAANSEASKAAQLSALTPDAAYAALSAAYFKLDPKVRNASNKLGDTGSNPKVRFLVTQTIADAYQQYLIGKNLESTYHNLVDGVKALSIFGVDVIPMPVWDEMIQGYFDNGTTYYKPHRIVLAEQENLAVGLPSDEVLTEVDVWYEKKERVNYMRATDQIDAKLLNDKRIVYGQ